MFGFSRQSKERKRSESATKLKPVVISKSLDVNAPEPKEVRDRRKISGNRVSCISSFALPNADPFMHVNTHVKGLMILNIRGCCVYLKPSLSSHEIKRYFPETRLLTIKKLTLQGPDSVSSDIFNLAIRRVRLHQDEHGAGIILRFVNLSEDQLDTLASVCERYANVEE